MICSEHAADVDAAATLQLQRIFTWPAIRCASHSANCYKCCCLASTLAYAGHHAAAFCLATASQVPAKFLRANTVCDKIKSNLPNQKESK